MKPITIAVFFLILSLNSGFCYGFFCDPGPDLVTPGFFEDFKTAYLDRPQYFDNRIVGSVMYVDAPDEMVGFSVTYPPRRFPGETVEPKREYASVLVFSNKDGTFRVDTSKWLSGKKPFEEKRSNHVTITGVNKTLNELCFSDQMNGLKTKRKILNGVKEYQQQILFERTHESFCGIDR